MPFDSTTTDHHRQVQRLPRTHLALAVEQCIKDRLNLADTQERLWREDPEEVRAVFNKITQAKEGCAGPSEGCHGLHAERMRNLRRPMLARADRRGLSLADIAKRTGTNRETLAALMEHHGYLDLTYYGGDQRRRLVSDAAFHAGLGHNVDPSGSRVGHAEGIAKAAPFPVFYEDRLSDILWTLDLEGIKTEADAKKTSGGKRAALRWLLEHHGYLPNAELARLAGCSERTVERARAKRTAEGGPSGDASAPAPGDGYLLAWAKAGMPW